MEEQEKNLIQKIYLAFYIACNYTTLNFFLGLLTGLIVNAYTGSIDNGEYHIAIGCFGLAIVFMIWLTIVRNNIKDQLDIKLRRNENPRHGQEVKMTEVIEKKNLGHKKSWKFLIPSLSIATVTCLIMAIIFLRLGNIHYKKDVNRDADILNKNITTILNTNKNLSEEVKSLTQSIQNLKNSYSLNSTNQINKKPRKTPKVAYK